MKKIRCYFWSICVIVLSFYYWQFRGSDRHRGAVVILSHCYHIMHIIVAYISWRLSGVAQATVTLNDSNCQRRAAPKHQGYRPIPIALCNITTVYYKLKYKTIGAMYRRQQQTYCCVPR